MPIYDNNGTVNAQIGKIWDNDGTANRQIGKIYDNDGTTNSPIFSATIPTFLYQNGAPDGESFINMVGSNYSNNSDNITGFGGLGFREDDFNISIYRYQKYMIYLRARASSRYSENWYCSNQGISNYMDLSDVKTINVKGIYEMYAPEKCHIECQIDIGLEDNNDKWLEIASKETIVYTGDVTTDYVSRIIKYEVEKDIQDTDLNLSNCRLVIRTRIDISYSGSDAITGQCENFIESITCTAVQ